MVNGYCQNHVSESSKTKIRLGILKVRMRIVWISRKYIRIYRLKINIRFDRLQIKITFHNVKCSNKDEINDRIRKISIEEKDIRYLKMKYKLSSSDLIYFNH